MTKAILILEDDDSTDEVKVNLDFDPPITSSTTPTHAQSMAFAALRHLTENYGQEQESEEEEAPQDPPVQ